MPLTVLLFIALPALALLLGAAVAVIRSPGPLAQSAVQHFAAGVVFAAVATELFPDILRGAHPWASMIGFVAGVAAMFGMKRLAESLEHPGAQTASARLPVGLLAAVAIDAVLDGLVIGIGFATGARQGVFIALSLTLEMLFLGLALAATLTSQARSRRMVLGVGAGLGAALALAAVAGVLLFSGLSAMVLTGLLAFGAATLLYLVTEELLIRAHEVAEETPAVTALFFLGFAVVLAAQLFA